MLISMAHATTEVGTAAGSQNMQDAFWMNMGLIGLMFVLFYFLMIRPQQKRMKEQRNMLDDLKKGDKVITGGGLYGTISKIVSDTEVEVDLGNIKVTSMRYSLQTRLDDSTPVHTPVNDIEPAAGEPKKTATKTKAASKTTAKKAAPKKTAGTTAKKSTTTKKTTAKKKA